MVIVRRGFSFRSFGVFPKDVSTIVMTVQWPAELVRISY